MVEMTEPTCENCGNIATFCDCFDNLDNMQEVIAWRIKHEHFSSKYLTYKD